MSVTPSEDGDVVVHPETHNGGHRMSNVQHAYGNGPPPFHSHKNGVTGMVSGAVTNLMAPMKDPLWHKGANAFATRKTVITAILTITLLTSTAGQLKSLMRVNPHYPFYSAVLGLLITCILLEIAAGIILFLLGRLNLNIENDRPRCELLQNVLMGIAVVLLILNILITAFGIEELQYFPEGYFKYLDTNAPVTAPTRTTPFPIPTVPAAFIRFPARENTTTDRLF